MFSIISPRVTFAGAYLNLADLYRQQGRIEEGQKQLLHGLQQEPEAASLHHALGLLRVRQSDLPGALVHLQKAAQLEPNDARYGYMYGVALNSADKVKEAIAALTAIAKVRPYD